MASDGGIFNYGDAGFYGSAGSIKLNRPIVGMASTHDGGGYWLVASDGGIFSYGDASFHGSAGSLTLNKPVVGMAPTKDGGGYWLVASDGGIFNYGDAPFHGSAGSLSLNKPVVGMAPTLGRRRLLAGRHRRRHLQLRRCELLRLDRIDRAERAGRGDVGGLTLADGSGHRLGHQVLDRDLVLGGARRGLPAPCPRAGGPGQAHHDGEVERGV